MTDNTTKIITLLAVLIVSATLSGCIDSETTDIQTSIRTDIDTINHQVPELTSESVPELTSKVSLTPEKRHIQITTSQKYDLLLVAVNGGDDYQQLREVQIIVNNETLDTYTPEYQIQRPIKCTIVDEWKVVCKGVFEDGEIQTLLTTGFNGLPDSYTETTMTSDQYDNPIPTPTVVPTPVPTSVSTQKYKDLPQSQSMECIVFTMNKVNDYDSIIIHHAVPRGCNAKGTLCYLDWIQISVDDQIITMLQPTIIDGNTDYEIAELPMIVDLPNGLNSSGKITIMGYFSDNRADGISTDRFVECPLEKGEYNIPVYRQCPPAETVKELLEEMKD